MDVCIAGYCNKGLKFTKEDFALNKDLQATLTPAVATMDIGQVIDSSYLDKLQQMGFNAEIEFP
jgi:hypothetical protein